MSPFLETNSKEARPEHPPGVHLGPEGKPQLLQGGTLLHQRSQELGQARRLWPHWEGAQQVEGVCEVGTWNTQLLRYGEAEARLCAALLQCYLLTG